MRADVRLVGYLGVACGAAGARLGVDEGDGGVVLLDHGFGCEIRKGANF